MDGKGSPVNATQLTLYRRSENNEKPSSKLKRHIEHSEVQYEHIEELVDIGDGEHSLLVQAKRLGLPDECDFTCQSIAELYEEVHLGTCLRAPV